MEENGTHITENNPSGLSAEALALLANSAGIGLLNWHLPTGEISMNRPVARLTGYELGEIPHSENSRVSLIFEDDRAFVEENVQACINGFVDGYEIEYRMCRKDGSLVWVKETAQVYEKDDNGRPVRIAALVNDLSAIKMVEHKALEMERQNRWLSTTQSKDRLTDDNRLLRAANSSAAIIIGGFYQDYEQVVTKALQILAESLCASSVFVWRNVVEEQELFCYRRAQWFSERDIPFMPDVHERISYKEYLPNWRKHCASPLCLRVKDMNPQLIKAMGLQGLYSVMMVPLHLHGSFWGVFCFGDNTPGRVFTENEAEIMNAGCLIVASSISRNETFVKLNIAREAAMASAKAKSEFLSRMSHEIRTPMNAIIGMTTIAKKTTNAEKIRYCLDKVDASSRQLLGIINDVLDMSKIDANKLEIVQSEFDFEKMMQNVFNVVQVRLDEKHQDLYIDFTNAFTHRVISDELRLSQVLINLLNNAIKFTPDCGHISLTIRQTPVADGRSKLHVEVKDNGIGIDKCHQALVFDSFEQGDGSITRQFGGTGLGLAICKKIIELMGGSIWVESEPGKGANFIFEIEVGWGKELSSTVSSAIVSQDMCILVVDDSADVLEYFNNILGSFSIQCDTALGGPEALLAIKRRAANGLPPYNMIFIDWNMPGMNGGSTAREIRQLMDDDIIVVMISVADWSDIEKEARSCGVNNFMPKPVLPSMLYNTIIDLAGESLVTEKNFDIKSLPDWSKKTLLLVEDIDINREIVISVLEETKINIICASNGVEAVARFKELGDQLDVVLMDVQMPVLDGLGATRKIRAIDTSWAKNVPIIAMTANAFKEDEEQCLVAGMNAHVAKPLSVEELMRTMAKEMAIHTKPF